MGFFATGPNDPLITLLIDKEVQERRRLSKLLREFAPEFTGIAEASDDAEALSKIDRFSPNLIFVAFPVNTNLMTTLCEGIAQNVPKVTVCRNARASTELIQKLGGTYLNKPVRAQNLRDLLDLLEQETQLNTGISFVESALTGQPYINGNGQFVRKRPNGFKLNGANNGNGHENGERTYLHRLIVRRQGRFRLLPTERVLWFGTEYRLVYAYTEKRRYPIDFGLDQLEKKLNPDEFVRIHRSAIVNIARIKEIVASANGRHKVLLDEPQKRMLPLSASRAKPIKDFLQNGLH